MRNGKSIILCLATMSLLASCGGGSNSSSSSLSSSSKPEYEYGENEMYEKLWEGNIVHNETVSLIEGEDGVISAGLVYAPKKIICVRDYSLNKVYKEGEDYTFSGKKIILTEGSKIPYFTQANLRGEGLSEESGISTYAGPNNTRIMWTEGVGLIMHQVAVSYTHDDVWTDAKPTYIGDSLPTTESKLANGEPLSICFFGDSIMTGCNSSGKLGVEPFQDIYPEAVTGLLQKAHPNSAITMQNKSTGGWLSADGLSNIDVAVNPLHSDLVFLGFGMNDGSWNVKTETYIDNIDTMIKSVRARTPGAEVVVVSTILANPGSTQKRWAREIPCSLKRAGRGL